MATAQELNWDGWGWCYSLVLHKETTLVFVYESTSCHSMTNYTSIAQIKRTARKVVVGVGKHTHTQLTQVEATFSDDPRADVWSSFQEADCLAQLTYNGCLLSMTRVSHFCEFGIS